MGDSQSMSQRIGSGKPEASGGSPARSSGGSSSGSSSGGSSSTTSGGSSSTGSFFGGFMPRTSPRNSTSGSNSSNGGSSRGTSSIGSPAGDSFFGGFTPRTSRSTGGSSGGASSGGGFSPSFARAQQSLADTAVREGTVSGMKGPISQAIRDDGARATAELRDLSRRIGRQSPKLARELDAMTRDAVMRERPDLLAPGRTDGGTSLDRSASDGGFGRGGARGAGRNGDGPATPFFSQSANDPGGPAGQPQQQPFFAGLNDPAQSQPQNLTAQPQGDEPTAVGDPAPQVGRPDDGFTLPPDAVETVPIDDTGGGPEGIVDPETGGLLRNRDGEPFPAPNDGTQLTRPDVDTAKRAGAIADEIYTRVQEGRPLTAQESRELQQRIADAGIEDPALRSTLMDAAQTAMSPGRATISMMNADNVVERASNPTFHAKVRENEAFLAGTDSYPGGREAYAEDSAQAWNDVNRMADDFADAIIAADDARKNLEQYAREVGSNPNSIERRNLGNLLAEAERTSAEAKNASDSYVDAATKASNLPPPPHEEIDSAATRQWRAAGREFPYMEAAALALGMVATGGMSLAMRGAIVAGRMMAAAGSIAAENQRQFLNNARDAYRQAGGDPNDPVAFGRWAENNPQAIRQAARNAQRTTLVNAGIDMASGGIARRIIGLAQPGESVGAEIGRNAITNVTGSIVGSVGQRTFDALQDRDNN